MAGAVGALDEAIREYLVFRGFSQTLKVFEQEKKDDRDKGFRVSTLYSMQLHVRVHCYVHVEYLGYVIGRHHHG